MKSAPSTKAKQTKVAAKQTKPAVRVFEWLPPADMHRHAADAARASQPQLLDKWMRQLDSEEGQYHSGVLHLEVSLRCALKAAPPAPHPFRTALVCESLARLPAYTPMLKPLIQLLRHEMLRAIYIDYDAAEARGVAMDARSLSKIQPFFSEVGAVHEKNVELQELLGAWHHAGRESYVALSRTTSGPSFPAETVSCANARPPLLVARSSAWPRRLAASASRSGPRRDCAFLWHLALAPSVCRRRASSRRSLSAALRHLTRRCITSAV